MIQVTSLPLSSPELSRIKTWLASDEAGRLVEVINADIIRLQVELANAAAQTLEYPNQVDAGKMALEQIGRLKNFLDILAKYTKMEAYALVKLEPQNE